ncbi:MAG: H-NS histone family protein [Thermomonas sp.]
MSIDLEGLSAKQLEAVIARAKKRKDALSKRKPIAAVRKKLVALAKADGYTIAELFGEDAHANADLAPAARRARKSTKGRVLGKVAPKYRNPENPKETWSGRGMQPRWLAEQVKRGKSAADFLISAKPTPKAQVAGRRVVKAADA